MFKALLKTRLAALFSSMFRGSKTKKKRSLGTKILFAFLGVYVGACFVLLFGMQFYSLADPLHMAGLDWLYFTFAGIAATGLCFIGSVFTAQAQLYDAKDNELLLSMPIPPRMILGSRMVMLLLLNYIFAAVVLWTAGVIYAIKFTVTAQGVIFFLLAFMAIPFLVLALSCVLGYVLAVLSARIRNKSMVQTVLSVGFLLLYFLVIGRMNEYLALLIQNSAQIGASIQASVFPAYHFGMACMGEPLSLLYFLLCAFVPFVLVYIVLSRSFIKVATTKRGFAKIKYEKRALKVSSPLKALLSKELRHFGSNGMYIMNSSLGVLFVLIIPIMYLLNQDMVMGLLSSIPGANAYLGLIAVTVLCFLATTNTVSAPSISLEGKNLWIVQSMPVSAKTVLTAKALLHIVVCLPATLVSSLIFAIALPLSLPMRLLLILLPAVVCVFFAYFGVVVNLMFPKFDWINETACVKQGISVMICMLGGMGIVAAPALIYWFLLKETLDGALYLALLTVLFAGLTGLMMRYLSHGGTTRFFDLKA